MLRGFLSFISSKVGTSNLRYSRVATLMFMAAVLLTFPLGAWAQTIYTVTASTDTASVDSNQYDAIYNMPGLGPGIQGDLRYGIQQAIANGGVQTIEFNCGTPCSIVLNNPLPPITSNSSNPLVLTINGSHNGDIVISGNNKYRVFFVDNATVTLANLVIQNAKAQGGSGGAASLSTFTNNGGGGGGGFGAGAGLFVNQSAAAVSIYNTSFVNCSSSGGAGGNVVMGSSPWNSGMGGGGGGGGGMAFAGGNGAGGYVYSGGGGGMLAAGIDAYVDHSTVGMTDTPANDGSGNSGAGGVGGGGGGAGGGEATPDVSGGGSDFCCNNVSFNITEPQVYGLGGSAADYEVRQGGTQGTATQGSSGYPGGPSWDPYFLSSAPMAYGSSSNGAGNPGLGVFTAGQQYGNAPAYTMYLGGDGGFGGGGGGGLTGSPWYICKISGNFCGGGYGGFGGGGGGGAIAGGNGGFGGGGGGYAANAVGTDGNFAGAIGGGHGTFKGGDASTQNWYSYYCNSGSDATTAEFNTPGGGGAAAGPAIFVNNGSVSIINSYAAGNSATAGAGGTNAVQSWMPFAAKNDYCTITSLAGSSYTSGYPGSADSTPFFNNTGKLNCSTAAFGGNASALIAGTYSDSSSTLYLNIPSAASPVTAGVSGNAASIRLLNSGNNVITGYTGLVTLTSSNSKFTATPNPVQLTCGIGTATFEMDEAGSNYAIYAAPYDSNLPTPGQIQSTSYGSIIVKPAAASSLLATGGTPQSAAIGSSFITPLQVTVTDAYGNPISGATVTFTAPSTGASAVFSNSTNTITATTNTSGIASETATATGAVGQYIVTVSTGGLQTSFSLTNTQAAQSINFTAPATPVDFATTPVALVASASTPNSGNLITFSILPGGTGAGTISGNVLTITQAGTFTIAADLAGNANYSAAPEITRPLTVTKAEQDIVFSSIPSPQVYSQGMIVYLDATVAVPNAGNAVLFTIDPASTGAGQISGATLGSITAAGTFVIDANMAGNGVYAQAAQVQKTVVINKASQAITNPAWPSSPMSYTTTPFTLSGTGGLSGNPVVFSIVSGSSYATLSGTNNTTLTITGPGLVHLAANQTGNALYNAAPTVDFYLTITQATPALSISCYSGSYDNTAHSCTGTATGIGGVAVSGTWSFNPSSETNAGSYPVTGTFSSTNPNYVTGGTANGTLTITAVAPSLSITCYNGSYDGAAHTCTGTATGVGGVKVSGTWGFNPANKTTAGSYPVTGTFSSTNTNYTSGGTAGGTLIIAKATPIISWTTPMPIPYGTALSASQLNASSTVAGTFTYSPSFGAVLPAGPHALMVTFNPNDKTDYATNTAAVQLTVIQPHAPTPGLPVQPPVNVLQ